MSWADDDLPAREPAYADLDAWVRDWLAPHYRRDFEATSRAWCAQWREHPEAVSRLTGLWRAWEKLHAAPDTGLASWWRDHCDPTMTALLDEALSLGSCPEGQSTPATRHASLRNRRTTVWKRTWTASAARP